MKKTIGILLTVLICAGAIWAITLRRTGIKVDHQQEGSEGYHFLVEKIDDLPIDTWTRPQYLNTEEAIEIAFQEGDIDEESQHLLLNRLQSRYLFQLFHAVENHCKSKYSRKDLNPLAEALKVFDKGAFVDDRRYIDAINMIEKYEKLVSMIYQARIYTLKKPYDREKTSEFSREIRNLSAGHPFNENTVLKAKKKKALNQLIDHEEARQDFLDCEFDPDQLCDCGQFDEFEYYIGMCKKLNQRNEK